MWRCVVVGLVCVGCTNPDDILPVHGSLASIDSVDGQVVRLLRHVTQNVFFSEECSPDEPLKETRADADGGYGFELFRVETRSVACFRVETTFPSGSIAWSDSGPIITKARMAPLRDWRPAPSIDGGVLNFEPPVPWPDDPEGDRVGLQLTHREQLVTADGGIAWQAEDRFQSPDASFHDPYQFEREPLLMDALRLEDFEGTLILSAFLNDPDQQTGLVYLNREPATRMRAADQLSLRGTKVPLSRGLACPELATPCPLTDRDLTVVDAGLINEVSLELNTPAMVSAVVLRGASVGNGLIRLVLAAEDGGAAVAVERTVPNTDWVAFRTPDPRNFQFADGGSLNFRLAYVVLEVDAGTPVSRVTLQFPRGLARIQEVSVFE